ncbi:MAG: hypothetical protein K0Q47_645 [Sedimentibacter sp.]|nr:hypothetical protein [Sedimentibacter sp.]
MIITPVSLFCKQIFRVTNTSFFIMHTIHTYCTCPQNLKIAIYGLLQTLWVYVFRKHIACGKKRTYLIYYMLVCPLYVICYLNFDVKPSTLFLIFSSGCFLVSEQSIISASSAISASFIPFVVTAGVPILNPLVTNGL